MIRFIYGNPGTGKTEQIYSFLSEDAKKGTDALLIVPEQMTVAAEREVIKRLPASAQLHIEVLNFSRLANKLFRIHGGLAYNFASRGLQKLLMWRALRIATPFLSEYRRIGSDDRALADGMLSTYNELTASGISLESLEKLSSLLPDSSLSGKLKDISAVCSIYSSLISDKYSDTNSELLRLSRHLEETNCFRGANVYLDGFSSLTGIEHKITRSIMQQADNLIVSIGIPSPTYQGLDTLSIKRFSDRLRRDCASLGIPASTSLLTENHRTESPEINNISENLWVINSSEVREYDSADIGAVELYRAADIYDECEYASAIIKQLVESGYRYRDIAVIARDADKYRGIIEPALDCMNIRYFISEKTDPSLSPIAKLILSALRIANFGWQRSDVISHLKTGLCGITSRDADIFECYTAKWNINGKLFLSDGPWNMNPEGYTTTKTERGEIILSIANQVKETLIGNLKKYVSELKNAESCQDLCMATVRYLEVLNVKESMRNLASRYLEKNKLREASECVRIYDVILDSLDCVCDAFEGAETPDLATFYTAVRTALEESELGSIPTSSDEVTIGSANMLRADNVKCTILLGACDGEFPSNSPNTGLLSDSDREFLINHEIPVSGDREVRSADELYYFRRAASAPSEKLIIFTRADSEPSIAFTRVKKLLDHVNVTETSSQLLTRLRTYRSISEYLPLYEATDEGEAMKILMAESTETVYNNYSALTQTPVSAENDTIPTEIVEGHIGKELRLSQSRIEEYIKCRFAYSCKYFLKLDDGKRAEFAYNNIGTFVHHILEKFLFSVFVTNNGIFPVGSEKEKLINSIIDGYISELLPENSEKRNARLLHLIQRLKSLSILIIDDLLNEFADSSFKPSFFELPIGTKEIPSITFTLNNGTKMSLNGIVDRVDIFRKDEKVYIRVVDYKTGDKTFSISDIEEGKNLQLLLYIFSLTKQKPKMLTETLGGTPYPAGITYLSAGSSKVSSSRYHTPDEAVKGATEQIKRTGLIIDDDDIIQAVSHSGQNRYLMSTARKKSTISTESFDMLYDQVCKVLTEVGNEIISGQANALPKNGADDCKYCPYSWVCRASQKKDK